MHMHHVSPGCMANQVRMLTDTCPFTPIPKLSQSLRMATVLEQHVMCVPYMTC